MNGDVRLSQKQYAGNTPLWREYMKMSVQYLRAGGLRS